MIAGNDSLGSTILDKNSSTFSVFDHVSLASSIVETDSFASTSVDNVSFKSTLLIVQLPIHTSTVSAIMHGFSFLEVV
jgi:hypothetical protein